MAWTMIHTYSDEPYFPDSKALRLLGRVAGVLFLVLPVPVVLAVTLRHGLTWAHAGQAALGGAVTFAVVWLMYRHNYYRVCREIRLSDDGTCELETKRRSIRLHASQIRSVAEDDDEEGGVSYTIRYQGGKLVVGDRMTDFLDFVARLRELNPGVDLSGFPAFASPERGLAGADDSGGNVLRFFRSALFPVFTIAVLAWLAINTLAAEENSGGGRAGGRILDLLIGVLPFIAVLAGWLVIMSLFQSSRSRDDRLASHEASAAKTGGDGTWQNRFLRSALFPLVLLLALAWIAVK